MGADFEEVVESCEGFGRVKVHVKRLDGAAERERDAFYALPRAAFAARVRAYAGVIGRGHLPALIEQLRHPAAPVGWLRRAGFLARLVFEGPLLLAYIVWVQPGRLRARRDAKLSAEAPR